MYASLPGSDGNTRIGVRALSLLHQNVGEIQALRHFDIRRRLTGGPARTGIRRHLIQGRGAARLGEHEAACAAAEHGRDPVGREVRLHRQIHAPRLEDTEDRGHPGQVSLGDHRHHVLGTQPAVEQCVGDPIRPAVECVVAPLRAVVHGGDTVGVLAHPLLEQLVHPPVRHGTQRPGQPVDLLGELPGGQQALRVVLRRGVGGHHRQGGEQIPAHALGVGAVEDVAAAQQPQTQPVPLREDGDTQNAVARQSGIGRRVGARTGGGRRGHGGGGGVRAGGEGREVEDHLEPGGSGMLLRPRRRRHGTRSAASTNCCQSPSATSRPHGSGTAPPGATSPVRTSRSPQSPARTFACAARSTDSVRTRSRSASAPRPRTVSAGTGHSYSVLGVSA